MSIRKDLIKVEKRDTKIAKYWARIPVAGEEVVFGLLSSLMRRSSPNMRFANPNS